jgi:hypothetical protein
MKTDRYIEAIGTFFVANFRFPGAVICKDNQYKYSLLIRSGLLASRYGASSGCGYRRQLQGMEGSSEYIEYVIAEQIRVCPAAGSLGRG